MNKNKIYILFFVSCLFAFVAQIVFSHEKISCGKPSDFWLIEEGEFEKLNGVKKTVVSHDTSFIQLTFRQEKLIQIQMFLRSYHKKLGYFLLDPDKIYKFKLGIHVDIHDGEVSILYIIYSY